METTGHQKPRCWGTRCSAVLNKKLRPHGLRRLRQLPPSHLHSSQGRAEKRKQGTCSAPSSKAQGLECTHVHVLIAHGEVGSEAQVAQLLTCVCLHVCMCVCEA